MKRLLILLTLLSSTLPAQLIGDRQTGLASYYSDEYNGAETAYGVTYNKDELVAAHKAYPLNSTVRVRNENNGKSVVVRIIDKGPFIRGRIIELSERAARDLAMIGERTVPVELTLLSTPDQQAVVERRPEIVADPPPPRVVDVSPTPPATTTLVRPADVPPAVTTTPSVQAREAAVDTPPVRTVSPAPTPASPRQDSKPVRTKSFAPGTYRINLTEPAGGRFGVQVGSFTSLESAMDKVMELQSRYFDDIMLQKTGRSDQANYKVILGPFRDQASAQNYAGDLMKRYKISGFTVTLEERKP
ncbi:septal ring lytic transglycosylase RlpA family protein [Lewinella sp. JB7]|uniref:septal ring lytic transglycosylase RlpA family protein n=1 Tax=Lewinella sp. JB7 TaxID=2962887 RepID=UPI0020C992FB|nr:septal ring lytic transglycosylase RlpA family protein [Lewinella sp. JB7]MCP9235172.1 septal ring lytic transglycosylase RlpA family protein [Lewinella sp. JB7]